MSLPTCEPMPLAVLREAFDHPDWLFEVKYDGFQGAGLPGIRLRPFGLPQGERVQVLPRPLPRTGHEPRSPAVMP